MLNNDFYFAKQQALTGNTAVASTNQHEEVNPDTGAGAATILFKGMLGEGFIVCVMTALGGTLSTIRFQFVGADDSALTSNVLVLAESGVSPVLAATDIPYPKLLVPVEQRTAKRYYGMLFTQGNAAMTSTVNAYFTFAPPSMAWRIT